MFTWTKTNLYQGWVTTGTSIHPPHITRHGRVTRNFPLELPPNKSNGTHEVKRHIYSDLRNPAPLAPLHTVDSTAYPTLKVTTRDTRTLNTTHVWCVLDNL